MASRANTDQFRVISSKSTASAAAGLTDLTQMSISADPHESVSAAEPASVAFVKGAKRKRLSKACDACHKSKRRCDGTAPCSNCYFASKECTYTDSSGRPVPAPRNVHPQLAGDHLAAEPSAAAPYPRDAPPAAPVRSHPSADGAARGVRRPVESPNDFAAMKRVRPEGADTSAAIISPLDPPSGPVASSVSPSSLLDPTTTHELTNLFFTHSNPGRMIIHKPSFSADLTHEKLPSYLVLAVCAVAAPHSKDVAANAPTTRLAGVPFFQEAVSIMFDASGRLLAEPNLATAQALCLLELHEVSASHSWTKHYRYFDLALKIMEESLDVSRADEPSLTTPPLSSGARTLCIERECTRRCFWLIQLMSWINGIYTFRPLRPRSVELMRHVRLPVDETSFELAVPAQGPGVLILFGVLCVIVMPAEFMHLPAPRTKNASQFGHLCRILSLYQRLQVELNSSKEGAEMFRAVGEVNKGIQIWVDSLADHLRFSEANLEKQVSMFETSSNTGAWCFCFMHVLHPCLVLSMTEVDGREAEVVGWVRNQLNTVFTAIGGRAKNTILSLLASRFFGILAACALWSYSKYQPDDPQLHKWDDDFERIWGFRVAVVADQWRKCQEEQRSQIGRTYPVDSVVSTRESPPAFAVADSSSSSGSGSAGSSPHELVEPPLMQQQQQQHHPVDRNIVVVDLSAPQDMGMGMGMGRQHAYVSSQAHLHAHDVVVEPPAGAAGKKDSMSLPSLKASGLLDSWNPSAKPHLVSQQQQQQQQLPPQPRQQQQQPHPHIPAHAPPHPHTGHYHSHPGVAMPSAGIRSGQGMPVGLTWLNNEQ
ncbi:hypothetical protein EIP91_009734 [Steccherinum ochraceum]|uniref:Zn(2)-C6 fungal-type domain-containing protein n=1 Tax=Steccherinum ochraceum TaxID=92696 RepID=A0A4V2MV79_9APHY|nr:hypothetical protein EIP91_009734 [Steccherinum ochraceum]